MAGSLKDALRKSGLAAPEPVDPKPPSASPAKPEWLHELPSEDSRAPYMPFDAPAVTKVKVKDPKKPTR